MKKILYSMLALAMAAFTFTSCEDVPMPYDDPNSGDGGEVVTEEPKGDGTLADPFNALAATNYTAALAADAESETDIYIKGKVVAIDENYTAQYGNAKFYVADSETSTNKFLIYRALYLGNKKYAEGQPLLQIGDEVVVCGKVVNYKGSTLETVQNKAYLYSLNGQTTVDGGGEVTPPEDGSYISETFASSFGSFTVKNVKGTPWVLDSYGYAKATGYDNASKVITPSASYLVSNPVNMSASKEATVLFDYVLRYVTTQDGAPIAGISNKVLVTANYTGDPTTTSWTDITGTLTEVRSWTAWTKFNATVPTEILGKSNVVFALYYECGESSGTWEVKNLKVIEGKDDGGENPGGGDVSENSITVTAASFGFENAAPVETLTLADGTVLVFDGGGNSNSPKYYNTGANIRMYPKNNVKITAKKKIASVIFNVDEYNGAIYNASGDVSAVPGTVSTSGKVVTIDSVNATETLITNTSGSTGAASQMRIVSLTINYAE